MNFNPERLVKILSVDSTSPSIEYPMISLPDNNTYWSDGWNTLENSYNNNPSGQFIYPKVYQMNHRKGSKEDQNLSSSSNEEEYVCINEFVTSANNENVLTSIENIKNEMIDKVCYFVQKIAFNYLCFVCFLIKGSFRFLWSRY